MILFSVLSFSSIYTSIAFLASSFSVHQQQYTDDTHLCIFLSTYQIKSTRNSLCLNHDQYVLFSSPIGNVPMLFRTLPWSYSQARPFILPIMSSYSASQSATAFQWTSTWTLPVMHVFIIYVHCDIFDQPSPPKTSKGSPTLSSARGLTIMIECCTKYLRR